MRFARRKHMGGSVKMAKSFTIEPEVDRYISSTKGERSASERVNEMLKKAMVQERNERLEAEARVFYAKAGAAERKGTRAFQAAAVRAITRD
jgi:hypothetical protein